jgi:hypothetical protein
MLLPLSRFPNDDLSNLCHQNANILQQKPVANPSQHDVVSATIPDVGVWRTR